MALVQPDLFVADFAAFKNSGATSRSGPPLHSSRSSSASGCRGGIRPSPRTAPWTWSSCSGRTNSTSEARQASSTASALTSVSRSRSVLNRCVEIRCPLNQFVGTTFTSTLCFSRSRVCSASALLSTGSV